MPIFDTGIRMISRLDRYIFTQWLKVFTLSLVVIVALLLIGDMQQDLDNLLEFGASVPEVLRYYAVLVPGFLPAVLPISLLISLLFALGQLHRNLEIVAMRAAGLSVLRITRTLWAGGAVLAASLLWLNAEVVPWSVETSRTLWNNFYFRGELAEDRSEEEIGLIYNLTFHHPENGRLWFINRFNEYNYRAYGVTVSQFDEAGNETLRLVANEGFYEELTGHWTLLEGRELVFHSESGEIVRSLAFERKRPENLTEDPTLMQFLKKRPQDLSFWQLRRVIGSLEKGDAEKAARYQIRYYAILVNPLSCLIVVGIAIPFALSGVRTNPMVGVAKSVGLFLLYYVATNMAGLLGGTLLSPMLAALLPNLCMIGVAVYFTWRSARPA